MDVAFAKIDEDQQLVFGLASVAVTADGTPVVDLQDDVIPAEELEKAVYDYVLESRKGGTMHEEVGTARLVESFVVTREKLEALLKGLGVEADVSSFKGAAAWVGFKVDDPDTWARVKSGELAAFSIGGRCNVIEDEAA